MPPKRTIPRVDCICRFCGTAFQTYATHAQKYRVQFCCRDCKTQYNRANIMQRFMENVEVSAPDDCWLWRGTITKYGYGQMMVQRKTYRAHRLSYLLLVGPIPEGQIIIHRCDNPRCVNPAHLRAGTTMDNIEDKLSKKRHPIGEAVHGAKLTPADVRFIRSIKGMTQQQIADMYGIEQTTVSHILLRKSWRHID